MLWRPQRIPKDHTAAHQRERRAQLRGLLLFAVAVLGFVIYRAKPLLLFHIGWWRP